MLKEAMHRRTLFRLLLSGVAARIGVPRMAAQTKPSRKVVILTLAGIRRQETFSKEGLVNIPKLARELMPQSLFYPYVLNEGVTSHFNTISSVLTGSWQHLDDWGRQPPSKPTLFDYVQKQARLDAAETWVVSSNKQVTPNLCPAANVILTKQLLIEAIERIILGRAGGKQLERQSLLDEVTSLLRNDIDEIGGGLATPSMIRNAEFRKTLLSGITNFLNGPGAPASGDELTFFVACEVMRKVAPSVLMINFSDVEVAHNGAYSLHLAGIQRDDGLCARMWQFIRNEPQYGERTTFVIMPEFGRDPDGSSTNGFFNHRSNTDSCRLTWMAVLGDAVKKPDVVERTIRQTDLIPTLGTLLGVDCDQADGQRLGEFSA